jgi:hypothetical protein
VICHCKLYPMILSMSCSMQRLATMDGSKSGGSVVEITGSYRFFGWLVPRSHDEQVWFVLGVALGDAAEPATVTYNHHLVIVVG